MNKLIVDNLCLLQQYKLKYDSMISHKHASWINFCDHSRLVHQSLKNWPLLRGYFTS